jgi:hypothetical protein
MSIPIKKMKPIETRESYQDRVNKKTIVELSKLCNSIGFNDLGACVDKESLGNLLWNNYIKSGSDPLAVGRKRKAASDSEDGDDAPSKRKIKMDATVKEEPVESSEQPIVQEEPVEQPTPVGKVEEPMPMTMPMEKVENISADLAIKLGNKTMLALKAIAAGLCISDMEMYSTKASLVGAILAKGYIPPNPKATTKPPSNCGSNTEDVMDEQSRTMIKKLADKTRAELDEIRTRLGIDAASTLTKTGIASLIVAAGYIPPTRGSKKQQEDKQQVTQAVCKNPVPACVHLHREPISLMREPNGTGIFLLDNIKFVVDPVLNRVCGILDDDGSIRNLSVSDARRCKELGILFNYEMVDFSAQQELIHLDQATLNTFNEEEEEVELDMDDE